MNKSAILNLIIGGLMLFSGSLFAAGQDADVPSASATQPEAAMSEKEKIDAAKRAAELHAFPEPVVGDPVRGKQKAFMCKGCHNNQGYKTAYPKVYEVPRLGGQHAEYIVSALGQYKSGERSFATMRAMAANLTDQDMADLAAYYSSAN